MKEDERLIKERERLRAMHETEAELSCGKHFVFGIDEAGRGPLCGPVVAACVILPEDAEIMYLNDSKKLSEKRREELFDIIKSTAVSYGIGICSEKTIDEINILNATLEAMHTAFEECLKQYRISCLERFSDKGADFKEAFDTLPGMSDSIVLIDGNKEAPKIEFPQKTVVGGDAKCPSVSAASILAKVTRDRLMKEYDEKYPQYGFSKNKGYGTKEHIEAIKNYGCCEIHRKSFLKNIL